MRALYVIKTERGYVGGYDLGDLRDDMAIQQAAYCQHEPEVSPHVLRASRG
jgi:hypothetical protein